MSKLFGRCLAVTLITCGVTVGPAHAASSGDWKNQWERVVAAAKQEGKVSVYAAGSGISREHLATFRDRFEAAFPGIRVDYIGGRSDDMLARLAAERRAGRFIADLYLGAGNSRNFPDRSVLQPVRPLLVSPEVLDMSKWFGGRFWFYDKEEEYSLIYSMAAVTIIAINTKLVGANEFTSYKQLLDPKWRGKIAGHDVRGGGTGSGNVLFLYAHQDLGAEFLKRLYRDMDVTFSRNQEQMIDWLGKGRVAILLFPRKFDIDRARDQGLPVDLVNPFTMKEGYALTAGSRGIQIVNPAPHPNATTLYLNWLLSMQGQMGVEEFLGYPSLRQDTPTKKYVRDLVLPKDTTSNYLVVSLGKYDPLSDETTRLFKDLGKR